MAVPRKIMVVEDDPLTASMIAHSLKTDLSAHVTTYETAQRALEALKATTPDVLIIDYQLPGMTGIELFDQVKDGLPVHCLVIMASAIDDGALVLKFIQKGIRNYVIKDENMIASIKLIIAEESA